MCNKAVEAGPYQLRDVPDWFVTQEQIGIWAADNEYYDDDKIIEWYEGYKKRKAQKSKIKKEFMPIACHSTRYWDWCMTEDEKRKERQKNCGHKHSLFLYMMSGYKFFWLILKA